MSKFLPKNGFKWMDPKEFDLNKYTRISSKECVVEFDLEYSKELRELDNDYPIAPDKTEIKSKILSNYQLKTVDFTIFLLAMLKNWCLNFLIKKYVLHYENLQLYLRLGLKLKK